MYSEVSNLLAILSIRYPFKEIKTKKALRRASVMTGTWWFEDTTTEPNPKTIEKIPAGTVLKYVDNGNFLTISYSSNLKEFHSYHLFDFENFFELVLAGYFQVIQ